MISRLAPPFRHRQSQRLFFKSLPVLTGRFPSVVGLAAAIIFSAVVILPAQTGAGKDNKKPPTVKEAKTYQEAMVWFKKAEALIGTAKENSDEQAELFRKAIAIMPDFLEAHYDLGLIYANQKKMTEAAGQFERVLKIEPNFDVGIYFLLASAYQETGKTDNAIGALKAGLERKPDDLKMLKALAFLQFERNDAGAVKTLQELLKLDPADVSSRLDLALHYQKNGDPANALANYRDVLQFDPANFAAHYNLGLIYFGQKDYGKAAEEFNAANTIQPDDAKLLERLGDAYSYEQQHARAAAAYKDALAKAPDQSDVYAKLGFSLAKMNRTEDAVAALENSARLNPKNGDVFFLLGDLYGDLKRNEDAIKAYQSSLRINPKQKEVHYNLGTLYAEEERLDEAIAELRTAVQLDPDYAAAWKNLALVSEKLGLDEEAIQAYKKLIELGKGQANDYFRLGVLYAKNNEPDPAISSFEHAIEMEPDKYRAILRDELMNVQSVLDSVRYKPEFRRLLTTP